MACGPGNGAFSWPQYDVWEENENIEVKNIETLSYFNISHCLLIGWGVDVPLGMWSLWSGGGHCIERTASCSYQVGKQTRTHFKSSALPHLELCSGLAVSSSYFFLIFFCVFGTFLLKFTLCYLQHCPPLSGVEGSMESHLRVLGERERWNIDVLLRMLVELLSSVHQKAVETCPLSSAPESKDMMFSTSVLETYAR